MTSSDIPITYVNGTGKTDFPTLVLSGNDVAWYVINTQTSAEFVYPDQSQVGAKYEVNGVTNMSGPFNANPGSSWTITQEDANSAAILAEDKDAPTNPDGEIAIKNQQPSSWSGQAFDVGIYKNSALFSELNLNVGNQAQFIVQPIIYFGVGLDTEIQQGDIVPLDNVQALTKVDLSSFPNGVAVTLDKEGTFTATSA